MQIVPELLAEYVDRLSVTAQFPAQSKSEELEEVLEEEVTM